MLFIISAFPFISIYLNLQKRFQCRGIRKCCAFSFAIVHIYCNLSRIYLFVCILTFLNYPSNIIGRFAHFGCHSCNDPLNREEFYGFFFYLHSKE